jgi:hypothetical protein
VDVLKNLNILSLAQAYRFLERNVYDDFLSYYGVGIKDEEVEDLICLIDFLRDAGCDDGIFNQFYVGYEIPQIGKEFDLLRFGMDCVVNIELKKVSSREKVERQLKRNRYYLGFIGRRVLNFSFVSSTKEFFCLSDEGALVAADPSDLIGVLKNFDEWIGDVNDLFNPSDYLVSPFNSTDKFLADEYFLTLQQEEIKGNLLRAIEKSPVVGHFSVTGSAGTGKTLLIYDLAKDIKSKGGSVLIIHCGNLNEGQCNLVDNYGWTIVPVKRYRLYDFSDYDAIVIDEAQRLTLGQFNEVVKRVGAVNGKCIFSYDKLQTLSFDEERNNIDSHVGEIDRIVSYKLTEKIRTNKEVASFIKALFNKRNSASLSGGGCVELSYFKSIEDARKYLDMLRGQGWSVLRFTPSQYYKEHHQEYSDVLNAVSHGVIGQEFDNVVVVIDKLFLYDDNGELVYGGRVYYNPVKMLFQNVTRTRKRLSVVIIDNGEMLSRCFSILNK